MFLFLLFRNSSLFLFIRDYFKHTEKCFLLVVVFFHGHPRARHLTESLPSIFLTPGHFFFFKKRSLGTDETSHAPGQAPPRFYGVRASIVSNNETQ